MNCKLPASVVLAETLYIQILVLTVESRARARKVDYRWYYSTLIVWIAKLRQSFCWNTTPLDLSFDGWKLNTCSLAAGDITRPLCESQNYFSRSCWNNTPLGPSFGGWKPNTCSKVDYGGYYWTLTVWSETYVSRSCWNFITLDACWLKAEHVLEGRLQVISFDTRCANASRQSFLLKDYTFKSLFWRLKAEHVSIANDNWYYSTPAMWIASLH